MFFFGKTHAKPPIAGEPGGGDHGVDVCRSSGEARQDRAYIYKYPQLIQGGWLLYSLVAR